MTWYDFTPPERDAVDVRGPAESHVQALEPEREPEYFLVRSYVSRLWERRAQDQAEDDARWARRNERIRQDAAASAGVGSPSDTSTPRVVHA
ncbi:hypothetical protein ACFRCG_16335 [Embleya sp. NPDC056575]|uniref:hypothetical protein n=1 Tax=unclassified Embleya TaxID=2699296 RepID=UPI0036B9D4A5